MKKYVIKKSGGKNECLFASKDIKEGEVLFKIDLSKQKSYAPEEIAKMPNNNHADYVGRGRYVISFHTYSYMNHSCNPNIVVKHYFIAKSTLLLCEISRKVKNSLTIMGLGQWINLARHYGLWIASVEAEIARIKFMEISSSNQKKYKGDITNICRLLSKGSIKINSII